MSTGWNSRTRLPSTINIINLLGNEYWLEQVSMENVPVVDYKPTGK